MAELVKDSIVYEETKSIFVIFGDSTTLYDIWDYFQHIGAIELDQSSILQRPRIGYNTADDFYIKAYANFLVVGDFSNFEILSSHKLKEMVSGEMFMVGKIYMQETIFIKNPSKKKLIIFADKNIPGETILTTQPGLEARTQFFYL